VLFGATHVGRMMTSRVSGPPDDTFNTEGLNAQKRATGTGIEIAAGGAVSVVAIFVGSQLMDSATPFLMVATCYLVSTLINWRVFRPLEVSEARAWTNNLMLEAEAVSTV